MRVCDIVTNPIWYDPRVRKQIEEYLADPDIQLVCVGLKNDRYNESEVKKTPCLISLVEVSKRYYRESRTILTKIFREIKIINLLKKEIIDTNANIIHANDLDALVPAYLASKKLKCKLIYDTHEIFLENNSMINNKLKKAFWSYWEKKLVKKVDKIICVSHAAAEYFEKKYAVPPPLVITNCVRKVSDKIKEIPKAGQFEALNHGLFYEGRGYETMIEAGELLKNQPGIHFVIRGLGVMEEELKSMIKSKQLTNVRMDPPVKVDELIPMAARSHVGVAITEPICLNFKLSISNKIFEYAAAGLPVIMSDIPEHRYLNEKYDFGIILDNTTPSTLADAALKLYTEPELYKRLSENARKLSEEINWENEFAKLIEIEKSFDFAK